jgi:hypothetical protein
MPGDLHIIHLLDDHVRRVPSVCVPLGRRVVVVRRDEDISVPRPLGRREHRIESVDRPPIGEKVPLTVMRPRVVAVRILVVDILGKGEIGGERGRDPSLFEVVGRLLAVLELSAERAEETPGLRVRVASPSIGFPDVSVAPPVWSKLASEYVLDTLCDEEDIEFGIQHRSNDI